MELSTSCSPTDQTQGSLSGVLLIDENSDAFAVRALSARGAARTLDMMYYIWRNDACGRALLGEVIAAAERGVAVRLLIDDINPADSDETYLHLNSHPNIELRLFNPSSIRDRGPARWAEWVWRVKALNRRMHGKAWIADGDVGIMGGRNVGDEYFGQARTNFRDLDVLLLGDAVRQASAIFDEFWAHPLAQPLKRRARLRAAPPDCRDVSAASSVISEGTLTEFLEARTVRWVGGVSVLADPPDKAQGRKSERWLMKSLLPVIKGSQRRLEIVSPYFIPGRRGVKILRSLVERGVVATILTNSLAATDVAAVHGAYANHRRGLLRAGVSLFEFQPFDRRGRISAFGSKGASLHTKAFTVDEKIGFIGSFNFDPRSVSLNTEMGILFQDEELVRRILDGIDQEKHADRSFWVDLSGGFLRWTGFDQGRLRRYRFEPEAGLTRRILAALVRWLPLESQL